MRRSEPRGGSRVKKRYVALAVVVAVIMGSERWDGPFTFAKLQDAGRSLTGRDDAVQFQASASRTVGDIHLTFDDGPSLIWTPQILDLLADHDAGATFFPIGNQVPGGADLLARAVADGHRVGNHTWDHDRLVGIAPADFDESVARTQRAVEAATGSTPSCLRPPQGVIDGSARSLAAERGLSVEMWTIDPQDWAEPGAGAIVENVVSQADAGAVILLHDGGGDREDTVRALEEILDSLGSAGFRFVPLPGC